MATRSTARADPTGFEPPAKRARPTSVEDVILEEKVAALDVGSKQGRTTLTVQEVRVEEVRVSVSKILHQVTGWQPQPPTWFTCASPTCTNTVALQAGCLPAAAVNGRT